MEKRTHVYYFDYLRAFAALCVIFMHVAAGPLRGGLNGQWNGLNILTALAFTAVPLFFMMSGYLLLTDEKTADVSVLLKKRLPRLGAPLAAWTVVAVVWNLLSQGMFSPVNFADGLLSALHTPQAVHFWYMYTLIALYALSPVLYGGLKHLDRKGHCFVFCLCLVLSLRAMLAAVLPAGVGRVLQIDLVNKLQIFGGHLATFVLGYYLGKVGKKLPNWLLLAVSAALWAVVALGTYGKTVQNGTFDQTFQSQSAGFEVMLAACLFLLAKQNLTKKSRLLTAVPVVPLSMGIYMMHNILLSVLHRFGVREQGLWDTLALTAGIFLVCFLAVKTAASIRPLCYMVTGMPYKTACKTCNWTFTFRKKKEVLV